METLIARIFYARTAAHEVHLLTYSYAEHMATEGFYTAIVEAADDLAEIYQGATGKPLTPLPPVSPPRGDSFASFLRIEANWIAANRSAVAEGYTAVENQIDEVLGVYYQTLDRLRRK